VTLAIVLVVVLVMQLVQSAWTFTHQAEDGSPIGLHVFGLPFDLVLGSCLYVLSLVALSSTPHDVAQAVAIGCLASYASVWGRALGYALIKVRAQRAAEAADPGRRRR
jgi:hypothetical protein